MPNIGFWATAGGAGGAAGSYELISTTLGTGASNTITFSSIPTIYKHLQIRFAAKSTDSSYQTGLFVRFNGDTAANYSSHVLGGDGTTATSSGLAGTSYLFHNYSLITSQTEAGSTAGIIDILDYAATTKNTTGRMLTGYPGAFKSIKLISGAWYNTAAVSTISLAAQTGNFTTDTRFSIYGIKA